MILNFCRSALLLWILPLCLCLDQSYLGKKPYHQDPQAFKVENLPISYNGPSIDELGYAGHIPVRNGTGKLFFWYFEPTSPKGKYLKGEEPLVIWLQGGPGASSMIGLFNLNGPLKINEKMQIERSESPWNEEYATLYIDQPVGTGYSLVEKSANQEFNSKCFHSSGYVSDQCGIGKDLVEFLTEFTLIFNSLKRPLYLTGESYAGKYIPTLASAILENNKHYNRPNFLLKGIAIGNGLTDPITQIQSHGPLAEALGVLDISHSQHVSHLANSAVKLAKLKQWELATEKRDSLFAYYKNVTSDLDVYDVREGNQHRNWELMYKFLNLNETKQAIGVPTKVKFFKDPIVKDNLKADGMKSVAYLFKEFEDLKVILFQGQFDYRDGPMSQLKWIRKELPCISTAPQRPIKIKGLLKGFNRTCSHSKKSQIVVLNAGHRVSLDQPEVGKMILNQLVEW